KVLPLQNLTDTNAGIDTVWSADLVTPQSTPGVYTLTAGPNIGDVADFPMDQNGNGINGEAGPAPGRDPFSSTLTVVGPITHSGSGQLKLELDATGTDLQFFVNNVLQSSPPLSDITAITVNAA